MSRFVFTCEPGWEDPLIDELRRVFPQSRHARSAADGCVVSEMRDEPSGTPSVALCRQCLPRAEAIEAKSISAWGQAAGQWLIAGLDSHTGPWRLHVFGIAGADGPVGRRRCQLIRENIESLLRKKQRRLLRTQSAADGPWAADEALVQVGLTDPTNGYFSLCDSRLRIELRRMIAPFSGGIVEIPADRNAPSRAFAKLAEAELRLGRSIGAGQTCVDLGSSPGSWAYLALRRGARVVAIDRSPLRSDLMANPRLTFQRSDAFTYKPPETVDWLLSDVVAFPQRIIELLQTWIAGRWCRWFCVTIKFRGTSDYALLEPLKSWLSAAEAEFILRRLTNNRNEVTAMGEVRVS
jgi:23S rRNA (cytidine2498-2'-O)-methyltransferase